MSDLEIPMTATQIVADHCFGEHKPMSEDTARDVAFVALDDAAPLIVAAELRSLAEVLSVRSREIREEDGRGTRASGVNFAVMHLRARADELTDA